MKDGFLEIFLHFMQLDLLPGSNDHQLGFQGALFHHHRSSPSGQEREWHYQQAFCHREVSIEALEAVVMHSSGNINFNSVCILIILSVVLLGCDCCFTSNLQLTKRVEMVWEISEVLYPLTGMMQCLGYLNSIRIFHNISLDYFLSSQLGEQTKNQIQLNQSIHGLKTNFSAAQALMSMTQNQNRVHPLNVVLKIDFLCHKESEAELH
ncbi:hypothetical protein BDR04DRAFT_1140666 [Suillus decipiens]|nr:hypothetical protein BDR04DRAFT_1140666 [Suillus decipiens]